MGHKLVELITKYYNVSQKDANGRYRSWEHCYYNFYKAREESNVDVDYLSLQLAFYLASWGMYRSSSFLLEKDYKIHIPVVEEILKDEYDELFGADVSAFLERSVQMKLEKLNDFIVNYYEKVRVDVKGCDVKTSLSTTLVTKILMGTLGCAPAYDEYFVKAVRKTKVAIGTYNVRSLEQLAKFYMDNYDELEVMRENMWVKDVKYPQMKLLDMGFWQMGVDMKRTKEK